MLEEVEQILDQYVRPSLKAHGGGVEVVEVSGGVVRCRLTGCCSGCPAADLTTESLIQGELTAHLPWVKGVALVDDTPEELLDQARALLRRGRE